MQTNLGRKIQQKEPVSAKLVHIKYPIHRHVKPVILHVLNVLLLSARYVKTLQPHSYHYKMEYVFAQMVNIGILLQVYANHAVFHVSNVNNLQINVRAVIVLILDILNQIYVNATLLIMMMEQMLPVNLVCIIV